jgi:dolichol-phosphate mannosyltransferase
VWVALLFLATILLFFTRLSAPLQEPQEARYAEIPRHMLAQRSWLVPILHGEPYYDKPPLLYWLVMASYSVLGVSDWAARLVASGAGFLTVVITYLWGRRVAGPRAGFLAGHILCLTVRYIYLARLLTMDTLLCLCVTAALAAAHVAVHGATFRWRWWLVSAVACGLGMLTKGPVALALTAVPVLAYSFLDRRRTRLGLVAWLAYLAVALSVAAPWYIAVARVDPGFVDYFFWRHNVERFVAPFDHVEPFWFYLPSLLLGMLPWTLLMPSLVLHLVRKPRDEASVPGVRGLTPWLGLPLLASLWCLLFFSLAGCKRPTYILPAMPLLALALGCYLDTVVPREREALAGTRLAYWSTLLVLVLGMAGSLLAICEGLLKPAVGIAAVVVMAVGLVLVWRRGRMQRTAVSWLVCAGITFGLLFAGIHQVLPSYARRFALRGQVRRHAELCSDPHVPVVCYPRQWESVNFYLRRDDVRAYGKDQLPELIAELRAYPRTLLFVKSGKNLDAFLDALPPTLQFVPEGRRGTVTAGIVQPRGDLHAELYAER